MRAGAEEHALQSVPARLTAVLLAAYGCWFVFLSVWRLLSFQLGMDYLIISNSVLWMAKGHLLSDSLAGLHPFRNWQEHFAPILALYAAIVPAGGTVALAVLVASQAVANAFAGWLIFLLGRLWLRSEAAACAAALLWLTNGRVQMAIIHDFHTLTIAPLFLLLSFWGAAAGRRGWMWTGFVATLLLREDTFLALLGLPLVLLFLERRRREALAMFALIAAWELLVFRVAFPALTQEYRYAGIYTWIAPGPKALLVRMLTEPHEVLRLFLTQRENGQLLRFLSQYAFLPLLSPGGWLAALPAMSVSLLSNAPNLTSYGYHYVAPPAAALTVGTLLSLRFWQERLRIPWPAGRAAALMLACLVVYGLSLSKRYGAAPWSDLLRNPDVAFNRSHLDRVRRTVALADRIPPGEQAEYEYTLYTRFQGRDNSWPYHGSDSIRPGTTWLLLNYRAKTSHSRGDLVPLMRSGGWRIAGQDGAVILVRRRAGPTEEIPLLLRWIDPYEPRTRVGRRTRDRRLVGEAGKPGWLLQGVRFVAPSGRLRVGLDLAAAGPAESMRLEVASLHGTILLSQEVTAAALASVRTLEVPFDNPVEGQELELGLHHSGGGELVFTGGRVDWLGELGGQQPSGRDGAR